MEEFKIIHHYKTNLEDFLKAEAQIIGELLAEALESEEIITKDNQA